MAAGSESSWELGECQQCGQVKKMPPGKNICFECDPRGEQQTLDEVGDA